MATVQILAFITLDGYLARRSTFPDLWEHPEKYGITRIRVFMPLGLPADHPFWKDAAEPWTSQKAWSGQPFPIDGHHSLRSE